MAAQPMALALVHHPVLDRRGDVVTAAVTNLDIHDLARLATTYGFSRCYIVTPAREQQQLVERLAGHWREGFGAGYNPARAEALATLRVVDSFDTALADWQGLVDREVLPVLTSARQNPEALSFAVCREQAERSPLLLVFGTGHGLAPDFFARGWPVLEPVRAGGYNHLSVRTAAAVILDRLLGEALPAPLAG